MKREQGIKGCAGQEKVLFPAAPCSAQYHRHSTSANQARPDLSDQGAAAMLSAAPLLTSNKSYVADLELPSSKRDIINALVFLINDVG